MKETGNIGSIKKWFAFDRLGMTVVVIAALALAVWGFFDPEMMMAGGPEGEVAEEVVEEAAPSSDTPDPVASGGAGKKKKKADVSDDDDDGVLAARSTGQGKAANPGGGGQGPNPSLRHMNMRTLYLGEDDWNFIGVITLRFLLNILFAYILIGLIFSREHRVREYTFSYFVSNILIFMVTSLLASVRVRQGFAFGLFAILSILRFRTEQLQIREMTFLFAALILGVINSLATDGLSIFAILWANVILCMCVYICDRHFIGTTDMINLIYDNTQLLAKDKKAELFADIKKRFGYDVSKVSIMEMNYLTDSARLKLVYKLGPGVGVGVGVK